MITVNTRVKLLVDIYDDGEDHHPPGYLAYKEEILVVREASENAYSISHVGMTHNSFWVTPDEIKEIE